MLQTIRERTQGWIAGIIITIIILTFALWGIHSYFIGGSGDNIVAEVNGKEVTREQLTVAYERLRRQVQSQYGASALAKDEAGLKNRALKSLIEFQVLKQAAHTQGFRVTNDQVDTYLENMPEFQVNGQFSRDRFQELLASSMLSAGEFLDLIKASLLIDQPRLGILLTSFALPDETNYTIALVNQERNIEYINLPLQFYLSQPITISSEKIQAFYNEHKQGFMTPEQVSVDYLEVSVKDLSAQMHPSDAELKSYYDENINSYTQPMAWKLEDIEVPVAAVTTTEQATEAVNKANEIKQALDKGQDFAKVAHGYTQNLDKQNWITLNQLPTELQKSVAELVKAGQVSEPIKTSTGMVIVKAVDVKEPQIQSFEAVKDKVRETYIRQHAEEKAAELRDKLADITYEHPDSLESAAKTLNLPIKSTELFTRDKAGKDILQNKKVRDVAFSNDVLNLQNNSDVIQLDPNTIIVLRVKSHVQSSLLSLKEVSSKIETALKTQESETRLANFAAELKSKLEAGADPISLATSNKLKWNTPGYIGRYSTKVDSAVLDTAFRLPNPDSAKNKAVYGLTRIPNGYAIIALKGVKQGSIADQKQAAVFAEQVQNSDALLEYELYKQSQMSAAKIKMQ